MSTLSKPAPKIKTSTFGFLLKCDTLPDAYLLLIVCCACMFFSLLFAEEAICKLLLYASLQGRDKLYERLWCLACLIPFADKLK